MTIYSLNYQFDDWLLFDGKIFLLKPAIVMNVKLIIYFIEHLNSLKSFLIFQHIILPFLFNKSQNFS